MSSIYALIRIHLPDEKDREGFLRWAFGIKYREITTTIEYMKAWNFLHGNELELKPSTIVTYDIPKMIDIWQNRQRVTYDLD